MKKVAFVSRNRVLIEKITALFSARVDLDCLLLSISRYEQVEIEIESFGAETVVFDATDDTEMVHALELREKLGEGKSANYKSLFLVKAGMTVQKKAIQTEKAELIQDFVVYDDSLDSLLDKISAM